MIPETNANGLALGPAGIGASVERLEASRITTLFDPLRGARGAAFCYGWVDHFVYDANDAAARLWAFGRESFVGRSDGIGRLWVNPLDWQRHGDLLRTEGACMSLSTRLRGWDGRLTRCWVTSLRVMVDAEPLVICYARAPGGSGRAVWADDAPMLAAILGSPDVSRVPASARAHLLRPSTVPLAEAR